MDIDTIVVYEKPIRKCIKRGVWDAYEIKPFHSYSPEYFRGSLHLPKEHPLFGVSHEIINIKIGNLIPYNLNYSKLSHNKWVIGFDTVNFEEITHNDVCTFIRALKACLNILEEELGTELFWHENEITPYRTKSPMYYKVLFHLNEGHRFYNKTYKAINTKIYGVVPYGMNYSELSGDKWVIGFDTAPKDEESKYYNYDDVCEFIRELSWRL